MPDGAGYSPRPSPRASAGRAHPAPSSRALASGARVCGASRFHTRYSLNVEGDHPATPPRHIATIARPRQKIPSTRDRLSSARADRTRALPVELGRSRPSGVAVRAGRGRALAPSRRPATRDRGAAPAHLHAQHGGAEHQREPRRQHRPARGRRKRPRADRRPLPARSRRCAIGQPAVPGMPSPVMRRCRRATARTGCPGGLGPAASGGPRCR